MGDGQDPREAILEAELREAVAAAEKAEAQARKARYDARAAGEARAGARAALAEGPGYPATLAAYRAMAEKADEVARAVEGGCGPGGGARVLIVDSLDLCGADVQAIQVRAQLDFWLEELESRVAGLERIMDQLAERARPDRAAVLSTAGGVAAAAGAAAEVVSLAVDVAGYLRGGYDARGQAVGLPDAALQALVAGRLDRRKCCVFLPGFHHLESGGAIPVVDKLNECVRRKDRLKRQVAALRGMAVGLKALEPEAGGGPRGLAADVEAACKRAELAMGEFAELSQALTSPPRGGGHPPLVAAALRHWLDRMQITHLLYLGIASSGGDVVLGRGLFGSGKAGYLGGCVITYVLARTSGEIVAADSVAAHCGLKYDLGGNRLTPSGPA